MSAPRKVLFTDVRYGYAFEYPDTLSPRDMYYNVAFSPREEIEKDPFPLMFLARAHDSDLSADIQMGLSEYAAMHCGADGPDSTTFCPEELIRVEKFVNPLGIEGYLARRTAVTRYWDNGQDREKRQDDFIICYELPEHPDGAHAVVFSVTDTRWLGTMKEIAMTFRRLR